MCLCVCRNVLVKPLNPHPDSKWSQYFTDNDMLVQIDKDCRYRHGNNDDYFLSAAAATVVILLLLLLVAVVDNGRTSFIDF